MPIVGLGTDIVEIKRFSMMDATSRLRLARRVLTSAELDIFQASSRPERYLAKRFAVKEAAAKSLGTGIANGVSFQHFEITRLASGQPSLQLTDRALEIANQLGMRQVLVTIADEQHYAVATVILST